MKRLAGYGTELTLLGLIVVLMIGAAMLSPYFFTPSNLFQVTRQMVELSIITCGMAIVIISRGIDLSIGALVGLVTVVMAVLIVSGWSMLPAMAAGLVVALAAGALNGVLVGYLEVPPLVATLGTGLVFTGAATALSEGRAVSGFPAEYFVFGQSFVGPVPAQVFTMLVIVAICLLLLARTRWGRRIYLIGANPVAARFAGIPVQRTLLTAYVLAGGLAFVVAVILSSRTATARVDIGDSYVLASISAVVFGGISLMGGSGRLIGAFLGVAVFSIIQNALNLAGVSVFLQSVVIGVVLILVLSLRQIVPRLRRRPAPSASPPTPTISHTVQETP